MTRMWWRRGLWLLLGVIVVGAFFSLRAHTQSPPQCDPGFTCAKVDELTWTGKDAAVGGHCVTVTLKAELTTMFSQTETWGFRRASTQRSTVLPKAATVRIAQSCSDPAPAPFKDAWLAYAIATDRDALGRADLEAARVIADPTKATIARGKDANWLFTVVKVPADTGAVDDGFGPEYALTAPKHWSQELGELRLPCLWVSASGSVVVGDNAESFAPKNATGPVRVCPAGVGDAWYDKLDSFFRS